MDIFLTEKTADSTDKNDLKAAVEDLANVITSAGGEPVEFFFVLTVLM